MRLALMQGARAQGRSAENPPVGCVLVSAGGQLLGCGFTGAGGRPHAEQAALNSATAHGLSDALKGATAYVTLEPCSHHGQTPPCADALVAAGLGRVVYAAADPDSRVNGTGDARLRAGGLSVQGGLMAQAAQTAMAGFMQAKRAGRPSVTTKVALSSDFFVAADRNTQTWLTGAVAKIFVHDLRSRHDVLVTGIDTVMADDPELTCRLAGSPADSPVRIVLDSQLRLPADARLCKTAKQVPVLVFCLPDASDQRARQLAGQGVEIIRADRGADGRIDLRYVLSVCYDRGWYNLLLEAGPRLNSAFAGAGLTDRVIEIIAPTVLKQGYGACSPSATGKSSVVFAGLADYIMCEQRVLGADIMKIWQRKPGNARA